MKIVVLKFGGTSVGTIERIKKVSEIVKKYVKKKYSVTVSYTHLTLPTIGCV